MDDLRAPIRGEPFHDPARAVRVPTDSQAQVQTRRRVPELEQDVPQGQRVLSSGHRHQDRLPGLEHVVVLHGPPDLLVDVVDEARLAERGIVPGQFDHRGGAAPPAPGPGPTGPAGDHGADLDLVGLLDAILAGEQGSIPDHQDGVGIDGQVGEEIANPPRPGNLDLPVRVPKTDLHRARLPHGQWPARWVGQGRGRAPSVTVTVDV
jgi:hypothetical protein